MLNCCHFFWVKYSFNGSICRCCSYTVLVPIMITCMMSGGVFDHTELTTRSIPRPPEAVPPLEPAGMSSCDFRCTTGTRWNTPEPQVGGRLTELLDEVTVIDALLWAEGGQLKSGRLLLFLRLLVGERTKPFSTRYKKRVRITVISASTSCCSCKREPSPVAPAPPGGWPQGRRCWGLWESGCHVPAPQMEPLWLSGPCAGRWHHKQLWGQGEGQRVHENKLNVVRSRSVVCVYGEIILCRRR